MYVGEERAKVGKSLETAGWLWSAGMGAEVVYMVLHEGEKGLGTEGTNVALAGEGPEVAREAGGRLRVPAWCTGRGPGLAGCVWGEGVGVPRALGRLGCLG